MIAVFSLGCILGVFVAGHYFAAHTLAGIVLLGFCVVCLGALIAAAETHGFEGQRTPMDAAWTWGDISKRLFLMNEAKSRFFNHDKVYVQTPAGPKAVTSIFTARINHEMSIVLDTTEPDPTHTFNTLKQGVM